MTSLRVTVCMLIAVLVLTPFFGFAAGEVALQIWNKHPRHASGHHADGPHFAWKMTPAAMAPPPPVLAFVLVGSFVAEPLLHASSAVARPPFVPPRA